MDFNTELKSAKTLGDCIEVFKKYYNVEGCELGPIQKQAIIAGLGKIQQTTGVKPRSGHAPAARPNVAEIANRILNRKR
jgi:hypothetical protein